MTPGELLRDAIERAIDIAQGRLAFLDRQVDLVDVDREARHVPAEEIDGRSAFQREDFFPSQSTEARAQVDGAFVQMLHPGVGMPVGENEKQAPDLDASA